MKEEIEIVVKDNGAKKTISEIRKELKESREEMLNLEPGSKAFLQAAKNAGELQHLLTEVNESVRGASSDFGDMLGNVAKVGAGITGAFLAAKGTMSLFGAESEDVTKAIEKMQSIMAMTQGLSSIDEGIKSFGKLKTVVGLNSKELGGFKKALIGTGLGALVVVLGSIIANWEDFTKEIGISTEQMDKFGQMFQGAMNVVLGSTKKIASAFAKLIKGDFAGAKDELMSGWDFQQMYAEGVEKAITKQQEEERKKRLDEHKKYVDQMEAEYDRQRSKAEATIDDEKERIQELISIEQERLKLYADGSKEYYDQIKKINDLQALLNKEEQPKKEKEEKEDPEITKLRNKVQAILDSYLTEIEIINQEEANKLAAIEQARDNDLISTQEYEDLKTKIEEEASNARQAIQDKEMQARKNAGMQMANNIASIFSSMADIIGEESEEAFKASQAFLISSAIINTLTGAIGAYTGAASNAGINAIPVVGPAIAQALGITSAAAVTASGIAQIAQISRRKWDDKSTSGLSATKGASTASVSTAATKMNTPVQYTQDVQGADIESAIKDTRVYVTEQDISATLKRVNVAESENTY